MGKMQPESKDSSSSISICGVKDYTAFIEIYINTFVPFLFVSSCYTSDSNVADQNS